MKHEPNGANLTSPWPAGMLQYNARVAFTDLCRVYGFEHARQIMAEIINDEAGGRYRGKED